MPNSKTARSQSVSIAGDGIEIGRLQIHMDEKRTSHIKSQILEARLDESPSTEQTGSKFGFLLLYLIIVTIILKSAKTTQKAGKYCANHYENHKSTYPYCWTDRHHVIVYAVVLATSKR